MKTTRTLIQLFFCLMIFFSCEEKTSEEVPSSPVLTNSSSRVGAYTFNGTEGDPIALETAKKWTTNFNSENPDGTQAHFFGHEIIKQILAEEGCIGIRMYYALDDNGDRQILMVGVDTEGNDLLPSAGGRTTDGGNIIADVSFPCPTYCSETGG